MSSPPSDRPRILVLIKGLGLGGAERLIADGAEHWDRDRYRYRVAYVLPWKDQLVPDLEKTDVTVDCIGGSRGMGPGSFLALRSLIGDWRPSIVHAHLPSAGILARLAGGAPVVYTEHNIADSYRFPTRVLNRRTYGRNAAVIAVSQAVADSLAGYPGPEPVVIPNGVAPTVTPEEIARVRAEMSLGEGDRLVVHVGNIRPHKGHATLISAARRVVDQDQSVRFVSIGGEKHEGDLKRVRLSASKEGIEDHLRFLGRRDDARAFLAAADLVVNPADVEGLPLAVLEALAMGRPVVATAVGGVPTVVIDGVTGRLVAPKDPVALADAILDTLVSPDAGALGRAGAALVAENHGIAQMISEYERVYREVLDV